MSNPLLPALPASIEVSPRQAASSDLIVDAFPKGTRVYITDIGTDSTDQLVTAAARILALGYRPVPHFASRRMVSREVLDDRVARIAQAGVSDVLVIGGGLEKPAGEFDSTMAVLNTGVFEGHGITHMGVAGHPEGSPDFGPELAMQALREKQDYAQRSGIKVRIVTQFGFDGDKFVSWGHHLRREGITLPIHLGVAGPAKITTLIKFAAMCGVGNSLSFFKKRFGAISTMARGFDPEVVVAPIEADFQKYGADSPVTHIHVFPFGGASKSAKWLYERGTWSNDHAAPSQSFSSKTG